MQHHPAFNAFRSAAIWIGVAAAIFLLWRIRPAILLAFGAILLAVVLTMLTNLVSRITRLNRGLALAVATLLVIAAILLCGVLFGATLASQSSNLVNRIEAGGATLAAILPEGGARDTIIARGAAFFSGAIPGLASFLLDLVSYLVVGAIAAIYLAAQPDLYRRGAVALFPRGLRPKVSHALDLIGTSLKLWVLGQLVMMVVVGLLSYAAAVAIGLPNPAILGVIAGLTEIVPYVGPFIGAVPAILVALAQNLAAAEWTAAAYLGIHIFEGYLVEPLLQKWFLWIPPVLVLIGIVASGFIFGFGGVIFAAPIAVVLFAGVKVLYVGEGLGERVKLPTHLPFSTK
jgi:predicted PurR-regulated permease PerM